MRYSIRLLGLAVLIGVGLTLPACAPDGASSSNMYDRQQQALKSPGVYTPFQENPDISGGGIGNFDAKALGKEINDFFNP